MYSWWLFPFLILNTRAPLGYGRQTAKFYYFLFIVFRVRLIISIIRPVIFMPQQGLPGPQVWRRTQEKSVALHQESRKRTSLMVWWIGIPLPMQGRCIPSLVQEDSTCWRATKPMHHNYWHLCSGACAMQEGKLPQWEALCTTTKTSPHLLQLEKACTQQRRLSATTKKKCQGRDYLVYSCIWKHYYFFIIFPVNLIWIFNISVHYNTWFLY